MKDQARIWRLPPCPSYDAESMESWLSDMAAEGWMLEPDDFFLGIASFRRGEPARVRYRLEASPRKVSTWDDDGGVPDREALELNEAFGWEYAGRRGQFFLYRSADPKALELHTDPRVQALAVKAVEKRRLGNFLFLTVFWLLQFLAYFWRGSSFLLFAVKVGLPIVLLTAAILLDGLWCGLAELLYLRGFKRRLLEGSPPDHRKDWRKARRHMRWQQAMICAVLILFFILLFRLLGNELEHRDRIPRSEYPGKPPFAVLADFAEGEYTETWKDIHYDYAVRWSNAFLAEGIEWREHARVQRADGTEVNGGLLADYYEARSEGLARLLAAELCRSDRANYRKFYAVLECPDLGMDDAAAYRVLSVPYVVLRKGKKVLHAQFYQIGEGERVPLEEWAMILADSIR